MSTGPGAAPRVLLDATAVPADRGGVGRYVDGLVAGLSAGGQSLVVVCQRSDAERFSRVAAGDAEIVPGPSAISHRPARLAWEQTGLPLVAQQVGADLIHSPYYTMPLHAPVPVVVTLHDVTFFSEPELHSAVRTGFYRSATRTAVRRAARVVVPSQATRDELVRLLDADPARIDVALHGVDLDTFHPPSDAECHRVASRLGLHGRPYVAFLGVLERRKNVPDLVRGWVRAVDGLDDAPALVLAGSSGWDDGVDQAVAEVPSHLKVVRPGFLRPADLPGLLGGAMVVAYPSKAEGFGLPVLEAMACGAAVLTARRLSLPEVGGDAVAYTEPDVDSIATSLRDLILDEDRRRRLSLSGQERAKEFTWAASAQAHVETYRRAAAGVSV
ncbi:MAG TPA: glycosyltransferase family 1 protein [Actinomycetes bacterium]|nr:glycosyltransferase family 1 protein [Actinomycetes bacterium]